MAKKTTDPKAFMEHLDAARARLRHMTMDDDGKPFDRLIYFDTFELEDDARAVTRINGASYDPRAHETLRLGIADMLERAHEMPASLRSWPVHYLKGKRPPPRLPQGAPMKPHQHQLVHALVDTLRQRDLPLFRNSHPAREPIVVEGMEYWLSACDVAAAVLAERGETPSTPETVKHAYDKEAKSIAAEDAKRAAADAARAVD